MSIKTLNFRKKVFAYIYLESQRKGKILNYSTFENIYVKAIISFRAELMTSEIYQEALIAMESKIDRELNKLPFLSFLDIDEFTDKG